jgi:hypothetical protein
MVFCLAANAGTPLFDMQKILDADTLDIKVLQDWHEVDGMTATRQKLVTIRVGELWQGQDYRVPVKMIVPGSRKAKGFHLTGGHQFRQLQQDEQPNGMEVKLLKGGVGLVHTVVQFPKMFGKKDLEDAMHERFIETLEPRYCIHYWAWAASLMRAVTTAYAETDHFKPGKVAVSGGSKNGKSPTVAIIHDKRITALHASVSPMWESPLRLCDRTAWEKLDAFNKRDGIKTKHRFLGGTYGPNFNDEILAAGHSWKDLQQLALRLADDIYISKNFQSLEERGIDMLFHPGTHDFSACDLAWGGAHYPQIPIYLKANSGHGHKTGHPESEKDERNKEAFLLHHFFGGKEKLLEPPSVKTKRKGKKLLVGVKFPNHSKAESGRIWWMYDRGPDGSNAYIRDLFPDDQWKDMKFDSKAKAWVAEIDLKSSAKHIDLFSNHRKTIKYKSRDYPTYISCPYTRIILKD